MLRKNRDNQIRHQSEDEKWVPGTVIRGRLMRKIVGREQGMEYLILTKNPVALDLSRSEGRSEDVRCD